MEERVAIVVGSMEEASDKLKRFARGETAFTGIYRSKGEERTDVLSLLISDSDMQGTLSRWMDEGEHDKLAAVWVSGVPVDWSCMYRNGRPRRVSLPTYPFEKERCWVPGTESTSRPVTHGVRSAIHPLLSENTSTFSEQRFSTTLTGSEPFLTDHRVQGQPVLPGVAYLEMARAGMEHASLIPPERAVVVMRNVVWSRPLLVDRGSVDVHLGLTADEDGRISFEVYGDPGADGPDRILYSRGTMLLREWGPAPRLDISTLQSRCAGESLKPARCYAIYSDLGIDYGPAHRCIERIHIGEGEVLAALRLPAELSSDAEYVLHPSIIDSALQASIGLLAEGGDQHGPSSFKPGLPFALDELEVFGPTTNLMWAYLRPGAGDNPEGNVRKLDVDVCDEGGRVCARFKGLSSRELARRVTQVPPRPVLPDQHGVEGTGTFLLTPVWDIAPIGPDMFPAPSSALVVAGGSDSLHDRVRVQYADTRRLEIEADDTIEAIEERIRGLPGLDHLVWVAPSASVSGVTDETLITTQQAGVLLGFRLIKALLREGFGSKSLGITVLTANTQRITPSEVVNPAHAGIHGLIGTVAKEYPAWRIRLLDMEADRQWSIPEIFQVPPDPQGDAIVYREGNWYKQRLVQFVPQNGLA
jgi:polyketide synthase PksM